MSEPYMHAPRCGCSRCSSCRDRLVCMTMEWRWWLDEMREWLEEWKP